jgi:hypothetical protein
VIVYGYREDLFCGFLTDYVLIQNLADFMRNRQVRLGQFNGLGTLYLLTDDIVTEFDAFVADEY